MAHWHWTDEYDGRLLAAERKNLKYVQEDVEVEAEARARAHAAKMQKEGRTEEEIEAEIRCMTLSVRTIAYIEANAPRPSFDSFKLYAAILGKSIEDFRRKTPLPPKDLGDEELHRLSRVAVFGAMRLVWWVINNPWGELLRPTEPTKLTEHLLKDDPTEMIDQVALDFIKVLFQQAAQTMRHPLSQGAFLVDEEMGVTPLSPGARYLLVVDPADDTVAYKRGLGGMNLVTVYQIGVGVIAAAALDFVRRRLYCRVRGAPTQALQLNPILAIEPNRPQPDQITDPEGRLSVTLRTSARTELKQATLNIYTGKAYRIGELAKVAPVLASRNDVNVVSYGGSRGPILVADSSIDAAVEVARGFRIIDALAGLFIAHGAGCHIDITGVTVSGDHVKSKEGKEPAKAKSEKSEDHAKGKSNEKVLTSPQIQDMKLLEFGPIELIDDLFIRDEFTADEKRRRRCLIDFRLKFVVAATKELSNEILGLVRPLKTEGHSS